MDARGGLIAQYVSHARELARAVHATTAVDAVDVEELMQVACVALFECIAEAAGNSALGHVATKRIEDAVVRAVGALAAPEDVQGPALGLDWEESMGLRNLVRALPAQERIVIEGHYFDGREFQNIAEEMSVTKGRISQIHKSALQRLRWGLAPDGADWLAP